MMKIFALTAICFLVGCATQSNVDFVQDLQATDSIVILQVDSRKPAKVEIFECTIEECVHGTNPPKQITLSFLHYPNCKRLSLGTKYLCVIRHGSGKGYTLIRSDMIDQKKNDDLYNLFWEADSKEAEHIKNKIRTTRGLTLP